MSSASVSCVESSLVSSVSSSSSCSSLYPESPPFSKMGDDEVKEAKLFVYGVNRNCPREVLEEPFSKFGQVEDVHITDKGYAFVTMSQQSEAESAIAELNGSTVDGQEIKVDRATGRKGGGGGGRGRHGQHRGGGGS